MMRDLDILMTKLKHLIKMKKVLFLLLLILGITLNSYSQVRNYKAYAFNVTGENNLWKGWEKSEIPITIDDTKKHIKINSIANADLYYTKIDGKQYDTYVIAHSKGYDQYYISVDIYIQYFNDGGLFLIVEYPYWAYSFALKEI